MWDDYDDEWEPEPPDTCYALDEGTCPVLLEETDERCEECRWLKPKEETDGGGSGSEE